VKRRHLLITGSLIIGIMIVVLCSCDLITTDKDRFFVNEDNYLKKIDIEKTGPDIVVPEKVGDNVIRNISLYSPYYSKINSIDVSNVSELEFFKIKLFEEGANSKLKRLDFSKNKKLRHVIVNGTKALEEITFNEDCEAIGLYNTSVKELDLKSMKKLEYFTYWNGPLENIDISNNTNLDQVWIENANIKTVDIKMLKKLESIIFYGVPLEELDISNNPNLGAVRTYNTNVKVLDVSNNPKLEFIEVDEGTEIIGKTNAEIKYWTKEDIEKLEELRKND
jgi:cell surface protein (putative penicillin-binding protein)